MSVLQACGQEDVGSSTGASEGAGQAAKPPEPVTISVLQYRSGFSSDAFKQFVADPVKKKYPHMTMELNQEGDWTKIEGLVAAKQFPDMILNGNLGANLFIDLNLVLDLNPLIKQNQFSFAPFIPATVDLAKKNGANGEMFTIPIAMTSPATYYNKDIFDKFAVPYPTDGMTWEQTIELTKRLTRKDGEIQYKGFSTWPFARLSLSMLLRKDDLVNGKVMLTSDAWNRALGIYRDMMTIPGNQEKGDFFKDRNVAMLAGSSQFTTFEKLQRDGNPMNWDLVTFPTYSDKKLVVDTGFFVMMVSNQTKRAGDAFKALQVITGKENELQMSQNGVEPVLTDSDIQKAFGKNVASLQGKNVAAMFKYTYMPLNYESKYGPMIITHLNPAAQKVIKGQLDVNSALREAEELSNKDLATMETK
jgi:multiple sugar transport system substrate-binding protein